MVKVDITMELKKYLALDDNINTTDKNLWDATKGVHEIQKMYEFKLKALNICFINKKGKNEYLNLEIKRDNKTKLQKVEAKN